jgi:hypothetical protein
MPSKQEGIDSKKRLNNPLLMSFHLFSCEENQYYEKNPFITWCWSFVREWN